MNHIIIYEHHERDVAVREDLKGRHKEHCLCYGAGDPLRRCRRFKPEFPEVNCKIALTLFALDQLAGLVTPVWECPHYAPAKDKK